MKLTWLGHACFLLESREGSAVFDPYEPGSVPGLALPPLTADAVLCSHGHHDHSYAVGVKLSGREPAFSVTEIPCFHDGKKGLLRGKNLIRTVEAEGLRVAHLGDLGHALDAGQLAALGRVDVLLIPVGGHYTIGPAEADALCRALKPRLTVPMHYRGPGFGYEVIAPAEEFLKLRGQVVRAEGNRFDPLDYPEGTTLLPACPKAT
ncbi:MAG: MBL fold metallo-hydrolase [Oscillospiraceae bacterium]|nr:MBL fold metallo-hydrolase [Oscillospiraceae bacterium]